MKTIILKNSTVETQIKADVFATNTELLQPGFETRFTAMQIVTTPDAIKAGININETETSWKEIQALATTLNLSLSVIDINDDVPSIAVSYMAPTSVNALPATVSKAPSTTQQFTATVLPALASQAVIWSIQVVANLSINAQTGLVTIGAVAPGTYTVTCKSVANQAILDTCALTVTA